MLSSQVRKSRFVSLSTKAVPLGATVPHTIPRIWDSGGCIKSVAPLDPHRPKYSVLVKSKQNEMRADGKKREKEEKCRNFKLNFLTTTRVNHSLPQTCVARMISNLSWRRCRGRVALLVSTLEVLNRLEVRD